MQFIFTDMMTQAQQQWQHLFFKGFVVVNEILA
jgi:hypothetical protein